MFLNTIGRISAHIRWCIFDLCRPRFGAYIKQAYSSTLYCKVNPGKDGRTLLARQFCPENIPQRLQLRIGKEEKERVGLGQYNGIFAGKMQVDSTGYR